MYVCKNAFLQCAVVNCVVEKKKKAQHIHLESFETYITTIYFLHAVNLSSNCCG